MSVLEFMVFEGGDCKECIGASKLNIDMNIGLKKRVEGVGR